MTVKKLRQSTTLIILLASLATLTACAENRQERGGGQQSGPPPEAYTACEGQEEGAVISIKSPQGDALKATCTMINGKLAAVPEGHKQR